MVRDIWLLLGATIASAVVAIALVVLAWPTHAVPELEPIEGPRALAVPPDEPEPVSTWIPLPAEATVTSEEAVREVNRQVARARACSLDPEFSMPVVDDVLNHQIQGSPDQVARELLALAARLEARLDEAGCPVGVGSQLLDDSAQATPASQTQ